MGEDGDGRRRPAETTRREAETQPRRGLAASAWSIWVAALIVWTLAAAALTAFMGLDAIGGIGRSNAACGAAVCAQTGRGYLLEGVFALLGIPSIWLIGAVIGVVGIAASERD